MKTIPLTRGYVAKVDDEDYERLSQFNWSTLVSRRSDGSVRTCYAVRCEQKQSILMHREILGVSNRAHVDHVNGNGLDNRRENIRPCTPRQNLRNSRPRTGFTSRFKGVSWYALERKWRATIKVPGRAIHLGMYDNEEQAARVYDAAAREHFGEFARPNFADIVEARSTRRTKSSKYAGVTRGSESGWRVFHKEIGGKVEHYGSYPTEEQAAIISDCVVFVKRGPDAKRNFPQYSEDELLRLFHQIAGGKRLGRAA